MKCIDHALLAVSRPLQANYVSVCLVENLKYCVAGELQELTNSLSVEIR